MKFRYDYKRDANEPAIVDALEALGIVCLRLNGVGMPDLLCYAGPEALCVFRGWLPGEVKNPQGKNRVTTEQTKQRKTAPYPIWTTPAIAVAAFNQPSRN